MGNERSILRDVAWRDDNFYNSRQTLAYATFPEVDATLRKHKCRSALNDPDVNITDPMKVTRIPTNYFIEKVAKDCRRITSLMSLFNFNPTAILIDGAFEYCKDSIAWNNCVAKSSSKKNGSQMLF